MTIFTKPGADIFSPVDAAGNDREVVNHDAQVWSTEVERAFAAFIAGGGVVFASKAQADANLAYAANTMAWVFDSDPTLACVYQKLGASGAGSWSRRGDLPYSFLRATNTGGTANAITATTPVPVPAADGGALISLSIIATNTADAPTVTFNGGAPLTITDAAGVPVSAGGLTAGMLMNGYKVGTTFRVDMGPRGWSPLLRIVSDGARRVVELFDWTGGHGAKPDVTGYLGATGIVSDIAQATDIRGAVGPSGPGTGDMLRSVYDPLSVEGDVFDGGNTHDGTITDPKVADAVKTSPLGTTVRTLSGRWLDTPHLFDWIAAGQHAAILARTSTYDATVDVQKALNDLAADGSGGQIKAPRGVITLDGPVVYPAVNAVSLIGSGYGGVTGALPTVFSITHVDGPAFRLRAEGQSLENAVIWGGGSRPAHGIIDNNFGVLLEAVDTAGLGVRRGLLRRLTVRGHPSHAVVTSGETNHSRFEQVYARDNRGHAFVLDEGLITGRANIARPGMITMEDCRADQCDGYALKAGNFNEGGMGADFGCYRLGVFNFEANRNTAVSALAPTAHVISIHGEDMLVQRCAFGGAVGGVPTNWGVNLAGRNNRILGNRYISTPRAVQIINVVGHSPLGNIIDIGTVSQDVTMSPAVSISSSAVDTLVIARNRERITAVASGGVNTTVIGEGFGQAGIETRAPAGFISGKVTIADDGFATLPPPPHKGGFLRVVPGGNTDTPFATAYALVGFDIGTSIAMVNVYVGAAAASTTTTVNGTTGTDGFMTIGQSGSGGLRIENRLGSSQEFVYSFL